MLYPHDGCGVGAGGIDWTLTVEAGVATGGCGGGLSCLRLVLVLTMIDLVIVVEVWNDVEMNQIRILSSAPLM